MLKYETISKFTLKLFLTTVICSIKISAMEPQKTMNTQDITSFTQQLKAWESVYKKKRASQDGQEAKDKIIGLINLKMKTGELPTTNNYDSLTGLINSKKVVEDTKYLLKCVFGNCNAIPTKQEDPTDLFQRVENYYDGKSGQWNSAELQKFAELEPSFFLLTSQPIEKIISSKSQIPQKIQFPVTSMTKKESEDFITQIKTWEETYKTDRISPKGQEAKAKIISLINLKMKTGEFPTVKKYDSSLGADGANNVLQTVTYLLKYVLGNSDAIPTKQEDPTDLFQRVIQYYEQKPGQHWLQNEIDKGMEAEQNQPIESLQESPIISQESLETQTGGQTPQTLNFNEDSQVINALLYPSKEGKKISENLLVYDFGFKAATTALNMLKMNNYTPSPVKNQGWNSVTFDVKDTNGKNAFVAKFAKGAGELKKLQSLHTLFTTEFGIDLNNSNDIEQKRGFIGISIPIHIFSLSVNSMPLNDYSVQIMNHIQNDANFDTIIKRLLGPKDVFWVLKPDNNWQDFKFSKESDLELMKRFGQAMARFQRGGKMTDSQIPNKTMIHGDLFSDHVLITDYNLQNLTLKAINPKFSLIDIGTMDYVRDPNSYLLLVDPMFFSAIEFVELDKGNFIQGTLDIFNNFYLGYVGEFSEGTLNKLLQLFQTPDTAYQAYQEAANYANKIDRPMKTRIHEKFKTLSKNEQEMLEKQLANLHRIAFLNAYYRVIKNDQYRANEILKEEELWKKAWAHSGLYEKLKMESER
jgi:hypothetical protein